MNTLLKSAIAAVAVYGCLGLSVESVAIAAPNAKNGNGHLPNGRPFRYLNSRIDALQTQIDDLIGRVTSLDEWRAAAEEALLTLREDTDANKAAIALLQSELDNVNSILDTKQDIITGSCPDGQYVFEISQNPAGLICRADIGANGLVVDNVTVSQGVPPNGSLILSALCLDGSVVTGGSHEAGPGIEVTSSGIQDNGYTVDAANPTVDTIALNVTATCLSIAP